MPTGASEDQSPANSLLVEDEVLEVGCLLDNRLDIPDAGTGAAGAGALSSSALYQAMVELAKFKREVRKYGDWNNNLEFGPPPPDSEDSSDEEPAWKLASLQVGSFAERLAKLKRTVKQNSAELAKEALDRSREEEANLGSIDGQVGQGLLALADHDRCVTDRPCRTGLAGTHALARGLREEFAQAMQLSKRRQNEVDALRNQVADAQKDLADERARLHDARREGGERVSAVWAGVARYAKDLGDGRGSFSGFVSAQALQAERDRVSQLERQVEDARAAAGAGAPQEASRSDDAEHRQAVIDIAKLRQENESLRDRISAVAASLEVWDSRGRVGKEGMARCREAVAAACRRAPAPEDGLHAQEETRGTDWVANLQKYIGRGVQLVVTQQATVWAGLSGDEVHEELPAGHVVTAAGKVLQGAGGYWMVPIGEINDNKYVDCLCLQLTRSQRPMPDAAIEVPLDRTPPALVNWRTGRPPPNPRSAAAGACARAAEPA